MTVTTSNRLPHLETLELRMIQIKRLVVPCPTMRCPERLRFDPCLEYSPVFPDRVRSLERLIVSFWTLEKVKR
jgi:hypothetical protein